MVLRTAKWGKTQEVISMDALDIRKAKGRERLDTDAIRSVPNFLLEVRGKCGG